MFLKWEVRMMNYFKNDVSKNKVLNGESVWHQLPFLRVFLSETSVFKMGSKNDELF